MGRNLVLNMADHGHSVAGYDNDATKVAALRRCIELSATKYCPVSAMLSAGATEIHHRYRLIRTEVDPIDESGEVIVTGPYQRPDLLETSAE